jgi:predicted secreted protein
MNLTGGMVLYVVIWFLAFFVVLPIRMRSQAEDGAVVPGTPASAPADPQIWKKVKITTLVTTVLWAIFAWIILSGVVTLKDIDWFNQLG